MPAPVSSARPQRLELRRDTGFTEEADKGKNREVAMAAMVFKKLQDAGLIPPGASLAGTVPAASGLEGVTWGSSWER